MSDTAVINFISGCIQQGISFAQYGATADEIKDKTNALLAKYRDWEAEEKAQASKDMVEVIGNCSGGHQDWEVEQQCYVENRLRAYQRKVAESKGYNVEEENLNG